MSSYMEALASSQNIAQNGSVRFDTASADSVGRNIVLDQTGTVFTIRRPGLYLVEWDVNLSASTPAGVLGIIENGEPASGASSSGAGNLSSGTLIYVDKVPFTLSLHNYNSAITIEHPLQWQNSAASIRILKFADGPSVY